MPLNIVMAEVQLLFTKYDVCVEMCSCVVQCSPNSSSLHDFDAIFAEKLTDMDTMYARFGPTMNELLVTSVK